MCLLSQKGASWLYFDNVSPLLNDNLASTPWIVPSVCHTMYMLDIVFFTITTNLKVLGLTLGLHELFTAQSDSIIARWEHNKSQTPAITTSVYLADPLPTTGFSLFVLIVSARQTRPKQALYPVATVSTCHFSEKLKYLQPWSAQRGHKQMVVLGTDAFYQCDRICFAFIGSNWKNVFARMFLLILDI